MFDIVACLTVFELTVGTSTRDLVNTIRYKMDK